MSLLSAGHCEGSKCAVHRVVELTAGLCCAWNAAAWLERRETHLFVMAVFYGALAGLEHHICGKHVRTP